jgi:hypothetical protein
MYLLQMNRGFDMLLNVIFLKHIYRYTSFKISYYYVLIMYIYLPRRQWEGSGLVDRICRYSTFSSHAVKERKGRNEDSIAGRDFILS